MNQCVTEWTDQSCCPEDLEAAFVWQGAWVDGRTYAVNHAVEDDGSSWVCVKAHFSDVDNQPPSDPIVNPATEFWELMALGGNTIIWRGTWVVTTDYFEFDAVQHLGSAYVALQANTGVEPGSDPLVWDLLVAGQTGTSSGYTQRFDEATATGDAPDPPVSSFTINDDDTQIATDDLNVVGADIRAWIADFDGGTTPGDRGQITIKESTLPDTVWKRYLLSDVTPVTGFTRLTVALVDSNGAFTDLREHSIEFARTGDKGVDGVGAGDVVGPTLNSVTDDNLAAFDTISGKLIKEVALTGAQALLDTAKLAGIEDNATADQVAVEVPFTPAGDIAATDVQNAIEELDTDKAPNTGNAVLDAVQTFTAGQRKQVTDKATWAAAWDLADSNDFNINTQIAASDVTVLPLFTGDLPAQGEAQAGEFTIDVDVGFVANIAAGWQTPDNSDLDLTAGGLFTLYYRVYNAPLPGPDTVIQRITNIQPWS